GAGGDVWASATAERPRAERPRADRGPGGPRVATGAPECCECPVCRAISLRREAGGDVARHLRDAGGSLLAAALERARRRRPRPRRPFARRSRSGHRYVPEPATPGVAGPSGGYL
ncbi:hypothetical protein, partial [Actinomadura sp. CNU-125]|uniref:hypothetical protein n=1 Tax=Actinomadura sp. CNU-125 TaxID=1904961 RepID=UPI000AC9F0CA